MNVLVTQRANRKPGLAVRLTKQVPQLAAAGVGGIELPPLAQTVWAGPNSPSNGYDPVCDYDIGQHDLPTTIGTGEEIRALTRLSHKYGIWVSADWPIRQYGGTPPYPEKGANGKIDRSIFYKNAGLFDAAPDDQFDPEFVPNLGTVSRFQHSKPEGWMLREKTRSGRWLDARLGLDGARFDEAKSMWPYALRELIASRGKFSVAEYYTGDPDKLDRMVRTFDIPVIDFPFHYAARDVSAGWPLSRLVGSSYADRNASMAYRYVKSFDTRDVVTNWPWFYLYGMTMPGLGFRIDGADFETSLRKLILAYSWVGARMAFGEGIITLQENDLLAWMRTGNGGAMQSPGLLCGFSRDPINWQRRWSPTPFGSNKRLHNYLPTGGPDIWTNADGWVELPLPPNSYGLAQNAVAYSLAGQDGPIKLAEIPDHITGSLYDFNA